MAVTNIIKSEYPISNKEYRIMNQKTTVLGLWNFACNFCESCLFSFFATEEKEKGYRQQS